MPYMQPPVRRNAALNGLQESYGPANPGAPANAADVLRQGPGQSNAPIDLASLRDRRLGELQDRQDRETLLSKLPSADEDPNALDFSGLINSLQGDVDQDPDTGVLAHKRTGAFQQAADMARLGGYGSPQEAAEAERQAEAYKQSMPILQEREKGAQERQTNRDSFANLMQLSGGKDGSVAPIPNTPPGPPQPAVPIPSKTADTPPRSQSWMDFFTGSGPTPYSGAADMAKAYSERQKYKIMPTPFAPLAQETSYANLQQIQAMFPGVRGFSYLMPKFAEHQAKWGYEAPALTYQRLAGMLKMLDQTEQELDDPSQRIKIGPNGQPQMALLPQTIQRAKLGIQDTRQKTQDAMRYMEQLYTDQGPIQKVLGDMNPNQQPGANNDVITDPNWGAH